MGTFDDMPDDVKEQILGKALKAEQDLFKKLSKAMGTEQKSELEAYRKALLEAAADRVKSCSGRVNTTAEIVDEVLGMIDEQEPEVVEFAEEHLKELAKEETEEK